MLRVIKFNFFLSFGTRYFDFPGKNIIQILEFNVNMEMSALSLTTDQPTRYRRKTVLVTELQMTEQKSMMPTSMPTSSFSQSRIAAMKNCVGGGVKSRGRGRAGTARAHPPTTPISHARPGVGYICGLPVQQPEQTR